MKTYRVTEIDELTSIAQEVLELLVVKKREDCAAVLALSGDLGAGKTTFMQVMAKELGIVEPITSPTFVIMKKYGTTHSTFQELVHIDAYRVEDVDEMRPLRFIDELGRKEAIIGIEWAERIASLLPEHTLRLHFSIEGDTRVITVDAKEN